MTTMVLVRQFVAAPGNVPGHRGIRGSGSNARPAAAADLGPIYRNLGQNYWEIRREWPGEDDYMSLPVLRPDVSVAMVVRKSLALR